MADLPPYPGAPRWVKVFGIIAAIVVLLFLILLLARGPHGPGRHTGGGHGATASHGVTARSTVVHDWAVEHVC